MKKVFLVTLVLVTQIASARSIQLRDLLTLKVSPLHLSRDNVTVKIAIDQLGNVNRAECKGWDASDCTHERVLRLPWSQVQQINASINQARRETLRFPKAGDATCAALPMESFEIVADHGRLLLSVGSRPCGGNVITRMGTASRKLIETANRFYYQR